MPNMLGLDPSLSKTGFVVLDTESDGSGTVDRGLLRTSKEDGILVLRLLKQVAQIEEKLDTYNINFIGMEAPFYDAFSTEQLFALNQFLHMMFLKRGVFVVCFPPQQLKKLVFPDVSVKEIGKPEMIDKAKTALDLQGKKLAEDTADAYWAGIFGTRFYKFYIEKTLKESYLGEYESHVFCGKHTFTRGAKKGITELKGIIYRENELFFDFESIKRRAKNAADQKKGNKK